MILVYRHWTFCFCLQECSWQWGIEAAGFFCAWGRVEGRKNSWETCAIFAATTIAWEVFFLLLVEIFLALHYVDFFCSQGGGSFFAGSSAFCEFPILVSSSPSFVVVWCRAVEYSWRKKLLVNLAPMNSSTMMIFLLRQTWEKAHGDAGRSVQNTVVLLCMCVCVCVECIERVSIPV